MIEWNSRLWVAFNFFHEIFSSSRAVEACTSMIDERERFAKKSIRDVEIPDFDATKGLMAGTFATGKDDALRSGMRKDARKKGEAKMLPRLLSACYVLSRSFRPSFFFLFS